MKFKDWQKLELRDFEYYVVEWRCNWHRGKKENKRAKLFLLLKGGTYLEFEHQRLSYKSIVCITKYKEVK